MVHPEGGYLYFLASCAGPADVRQAPPPPRACPTGAVPPFGSSALHHASRAPGHTYKLGQCKCGPCSARLEAARHPCVLARATGLARAAVATPVSLSSAERLALEGTLEQTAFACEAVADGTCAHRP